MALNLGARHHVLLTAVKRFLDLVTACRASAARAPAAQKTITWRRDWSSNRTSTRAVIQSRRQINAEVIR